MPGLHGPSCGPTTRLRRRSGRRPAPATRSPPARGRERTRWRTGRGARGGDSACAPRRAVATSAPPPLIHSASARACEAIRSGRSCPTPPASSPPGRPRGSPAWPGAPARSPRARWCHRNRTTRSPPGAADRSPASPVARQRLSAATGRRGCAGWGCGSRRFGGMLPDCTASTVLMRPAMPAAASRWPRLVLTVPISSGDVFGATAAQHRAQRTCFDRDRRAAFRCRAPRHSRLLAAADPRWRKPRAAPPSGRPGWGPAARWTGRPG